MKDILNLGATVLAAASITLTGYYIGQSHGYRQGMDDTRNTWRHTQEVTALTMKNAGYCEMLELKAKEVGCGK